jgi:hypothetical protein
LGDLTSENFGLLIAYLLPGFVLLWGARPLLPGVEVWLATSPGTAPTVGGFLYVTLGSVAAGMFVSALRWAVIDTLHHRTGIAPPPWDFAKFSANAAAFDSLVQDHYRYYQHYSNMLVALGLAYAARAWAGGVFPGQGGWRDVGFLVIGAVLYLGSRDSLRKYYQRTASILGSGLVAPSRAPRPAPRRRNASPEQSPAQTHRQAAERSERKPAKVDG